MKRLQLCWIIGILAISLGTACNSTGTMVVERNPNFLDGKQIQKVVTIDPTFLYLDTRTSKENLYLKSDVKETWFNEYLIANASKVKVELQIIDRDELSGTDVAYFNDILPLKRQILSANFLQEVESDEEKRKRRLFALRTAPETRSFSINPVFDPAYGKLSDTYGTPYFAIHGMINVVERNPAPSLGALVFLFPVAIVNLLIPRSQLIFYSVLVDIESGEVLYREIREVRGRGGPTNLNAIVYDSFAGMKRKMK